MDDERREDISSMLLLSSDSSLMLGEDEKGATFLTFENKPYFSGFNVVSHLYFQHSKTFFLYEWMR